MKIFVAQIKAISGDVVGNKKRIDQSYQQATELQCDICLLPELITSGYLADDLFLSQDFIDKIYQVNQQLIDITNSCALILPTIIQSENKLYNAVIVAQNGKIIGQTYKTILPNYGIFDEQRYFTAGSANIININGAKIAIPICEDIWHPEICANFKSQGAKIFLVPNASPFEIGKFDLRLNQVVKRYKENKLPIIFCNQAHAHDGIIFDGNSFCYDGRLSVICDKFQEDNAIITWNDDNKLLCNTSYQKPKKIATELFSPEAMLEDIYLAVKLGLKSYVHDNGFSKVILGLSGGIDSAIVAAICVDALGSDNVSVYILPSEISAKESIQDAQEITKLLNIKSEIINISSILNAYIISLNAEQSRIKEDLTYQNLQARIRGTILMAYANKNNALLITTGNKSEYATGYATLYGDMNGAFNPIKDLYKSQIFALAKYRNSLSRVIPENVINKAPSAELARNQKDSDVLPEYVILDKILYYYIELNFTKRQLYQKFDHKLIDKIINLVKMSEFKRVQSVPGVKLSKCNFEKDRRFPITNRFD